MTHHELFVARIKGLNQNVKIKEIKTFFKPLKLKNIVITKNGTGLLYFRSDNDLKLGLKKSGKFQNKVVKVSKLELKLHTEEKEDVPKHSWPKKSDEEMESAILETGRLFVRNLSYTCTERDLEKLFSTYGTLSDVHIAFDSWMQTSKGYAFVTYVFPSDAVKAFKSLDKTKFMDRLLHIIAAEEPIESQKSSKADDLTTDVVGKRKTTSKHDLHKSSFQDSRFNELKNLAGTGHNWNALFIRPDAVAAYLSAKFGLSLEEVLHPSTHGSVAVRLAHGETQLINEMRDFLQSNGLRLEAFERTDSGDSSQQHEERTLVTEHSGRRNRLEAKSTSTVRQLSGTAFLIKNLPIGTTEVEVRELLKQYSKGCKQEESGKSTYSGVRRVLIPTLGITAIVEYAHSQQAKLMYKALAYEPYKENVLYVQWLPEDALKSKPDANPLSNSLGRSTKSKLNDTVPSIDEAQSDFNLLTELPDRNCPPPAKKHRDLISEDANHRVSSPDNVQQAIKPVKSRKYKNKNEKLKQLYDQVATDKGTAEPEANLVSHEVEAESPKEQVHIQSKPPNRILLVRNVPFQATRKELQELFEPISGLMNVRLPKKLTGGHRGFAFVEFSTIDQAKMALDTLGLATHLLGRRLRMEFADQ